MNWNLIYYGTFVSRDEHIYRVEIHSASSAASSDEVFFPADAPLVIEWEKTDVITPVHPSKATLKLLSPSDRKFVGLYTTEAGSVRLSIHRDGSLYWRGSLDTEIYEEPYSFLTDYVVSLTFSDFGPLERIPYIGTGCVTIKSAVEQCLIAARIIDDGEYSGRVEQHISTSDLTGGWITGTITSLMDLLVDSDNLLDDGAPLTMDAVLESVLKPFALSIVQKGGKVHIYDTNCMADQTETDIDWASDDAVLSANRVYNNVNVTFSPADDPEIVRSDISLDDSLRPDSGGVLFMVDYHRDSTDLLDSGQGFRIHFDGEQETNAELGQGVGLFQVSPVYSGQDDAGIFWGGKSGNYANDGAHILNQLGMGITGVYTDNDPSLTCNSRMVFKLPRRHLTFTAAESSRYSLRINLSLMADVRYNPYEQESPNNERGNWQKLQDWVNFAYVPIRLILYDASGNALYHYSNKNLMLSDGYKTSGLASWKPGAGSWGDAFLCYYDWEDRKSKSGLGGWASNKPCIGYYRADLPAFWKKRDAGDYIVLPPCGGYIELQVGSGIHQFDYERTPKNIYPLLRWLMYKDASINLCFKNGVECESQDITDSAELVSTAREELSIETRFGTPPERYAVPSAKGYFMSSSNECLYTARRSGVTDRLERLLIATVYTHYGARNDIISGTAQLIPFFGVLTDRSHEGKFILLEEVQDLQAGESEISLCEIRQDEYQAVQ